MPLARALLRVSAGGLTIIKATGSRAVSKSRIKEERSSPDTPQNDIEPPIML